MLKDKVKEIIKDYTFLTVGAVIFAFAWEGFMIPNNMSSGGLMGLCSVIQYATYGVIQASVSYVVINAVLILLAIAIFGVGFGFKTIYGIALTTVFLHLISGCGFLHAVEGNFLFVPEKIMIPAISGFLEAVGVGLIIRHGGSTGGTDIIALVVNKYWPVSLSKVFLISDAIIITSILFLPGKVFADMLYGYIMMLVFSLVIDFVVIGQKTTIQVLVFSRNYEGIANYINRNMERGVTVLRAQGWYTKADKEVLLVIIRRKELQELTRTVKEFDPDAFMTVSNVKGVYGEGFDEIKAGVRKKSKSK